MREEQVTVYVRDDGQIDVSRFSDSEVLRPLKAHIDELRRESSARRRDNEALDSRVKELQGDLDAAEKRALDLGKELDSTKAKAETAAESLKAEKKALKDLEAERDGLKSNLESYQSLGSVEDLSERVKDADYGREQRVTDRISKAAKDAGLKPDAVLALNGVRDLKIEYRAVEQKDSRTGETRKVEMPYVVKGDDKDDAVPLRDDILSRFSAFESSLLDAPSPAPTPLGRPAPNPVNRPDPVTVPLPQTSPDLSEPFGSVGSLADALREDYGG